VTLSKFEKAIRSLYIMVAFASAMALHIGVGDGVLAAQVTQPRLFDMQTYLADRMDHVESVQAQQDVRIRDLSDKVTTMEGIGEGAFGVLGVLQILGLIAKLNNKGDEV
jgi:hypothetical protein